MYVVIYSGDVCKEVYDNVLKETMGEAHEIFPLKKSKRQNHNMVMSDTLLVEATTTIRDSLL